mmetsp:Transcript_3259/g.4738  ORF Transcript_3259/g.4738 Transcript_3259/m.4738 type:complete len:147 (+) Transcript_3259:1564-2004(+)
MYPSYSTKTRANKTQHTAKTDHKQPTTTATSRLLLPEEWQPRAILKIIRRACPLQPGEYIIIIIHTYIQTCMEQVSKLKMLNFQGPQLLFRKKNAPAAAITRTITMIIMAEPPPLSFPPCEVEKSALFDWMPCLARSWAAVSWSSP